MSDINKKQVLKEELNAVLGAYIPNKIDLENLTSYLYKVVTKTFKDSDMSLESEKAGSITELDKQGFLRAVHSIALSASSNVMYQTLRDTYQSVKNQVDMVQVSIGSAGNSVSAYRRSTVESSGDFDIDLSMGKTDSKSLEELRRAVHEVSSTNSTKPHNMYSYKNISDEHDFEFTAESMASMNMSSGIDEVSQTESYSEPPKFSGISLDY